MTLSMPSLQVRLRCFTYACAYACTVLAIAALPAIAQEGDKGERVFKKCQA